MNTITLAQRVITKHRIALFGVLIGVVSAAFFYFFTGALNLGNSITPTGLGQFYSVSRTVPGVIFGAGLAILYLFKPEQRKQKILFSIRALFAGLVSYSLACWITINTFPVLFVVLIFAPIVMGGVGGFVGTLVLCVILNSSPERGVWSHFKSAVYGGILAALLLNCFVYGGTVGVWLFFVIWQAVMLPILGREIIGVSDRVYEGGEMSQQTTNTQGLRKQRSWMSILAVTLLGVAGLFIVYFGWFIPALFRKQVLLSLLRTAGIDGLGLFALILLSLILFFTSLMMLKNNRKLSSIAVSLAMIVLVSGSVWFNQWLGKKQRKPVMTFACPTGVFQGDVLVIRADGELDDTRFGGSSYSILGSVDSDAKTFTWWTDPSTHKPVILDSGSPLVTEVYTCTNSDGKTIANLYTIIPPTPPPKISFSSSPSASSTTR